MASPTTPEVHRVRLDRLAGVDPLTLLRRVRGRQRVVALLGSWHQGEALIAFDPVAMASEPFDDLDSADGWWIGAWGYRLGARVERLPEPGPRPVPQPEHRVGRYDAVLRLVNGAWFLEHTGGADAETVLAALDAPADERPYDVGTFTLTPPAAEHRAGVACAVEHIEAGDIFQVNLCARLEAGFSGDALDLFCTGAERLRPAYAAFVDSPEGAIASFSPELFLRRTGDEVLTSPIKGTAPLDPSAGSGDRGGEELVASAKDRAENVMIVDLMRNDLGRVATPGSVHVPALVRAERHAVWHLVSDVVGHVGHDVTHAALLRATFPPGSVTGAPKVRAMEIIADLEATGREAYTGAMGHVSPDGTMELNVVIRTFEIADGRIWLGVGGGVVADSTPEGEYAEVLVKARPLVAAIGGTLDVEQATTAASPVPRDDAPRRAAHRVDVSRGVFTTMLVREGEPVDLEAHVARLDASVRAVYGGTVRAGLEEAVRAKASGLAGSHRLRVDAVPSGGDVRVSLRATALAPAGGTWTLTPRVVAGGVGAHKWVDRRGFDLDDLVVDTDGAVLETGRANVFVVHDDGVHTPPLDGRILPGTARARVIEQLVAASIPVLQRRLTTADVARASEVFATNTLRGVVPVTEVVGVGTWSPGPVAAALVEGQLSAPPRSARTWTEPPRVLFVDNYDSFVYNLVQYTGELGAATHVVRNDHADVDALVARREAGEFTHLIVSPGPGTPAEAGISAELIRRIGPTTPTLGVCLGHQVIGEVYGGRVVRAGQVVHGKPSLVHHDGAGVFAGLPTPLTCARYHSLVIDPPSLPSGLEVTARTAGGVIMGVRHRVHPVEGVQMHPESILTAHGHDMLATFLAR